MNFYKYHNIMNTLSNNKTLEEMSLGPGMYRLNDSKLRNKISYPWAPTVQLQTIGGSVMDQNFMDVSLKIAETIRKICEDEKLIFNVPYEGKKYWLKGKHYESCFVDGGVFSSVESSSAPFAIRANTYIVKPDELLEKRELFKETFFRICISLLSL